MSRYLLCLTFVLTLVACSSDDTPDAAMAADATARADDAAALDAQPAAPAPDAAEHAHDAHVPPADAGAIVADDAAAPAGLALTAAVSGALSRRGTQIHAAVARDGAPVSDAQVTVSLWMPEHGHGAPAPTATNEGGGEYHLIPTFTMAGLWEVTITATHGGDRVMTMLSLDVP
jgi:hypothetical protein